MLADFGHGSPNFKRKKQTRGATGRGELRRRREAHPPVKRCEI